MITYKSRIAKIVFDLRLPGEKKYHKDVTVTYLDKDTGDFFIDMEDIHHEENDSWNAIDFDDINYHADIQFFGEDDSMALLDETDPDSYSPRKAMTIPLHYTLWEVEKDETGDWSHTDETVGATIRNVRVYTTDGMKRVKVFNL